MATNPMEKVTNNSGTGYCKMPDGTLIQYGTATTDSNGSYTVSLPMEFKDNPAVSFMSDGWNPVSCSVAGLGKGSFTIRSSASKIVYYIAIGRWK